MSDETTKTTPVTVEAVNAPGRKEMSVENRAGSDTANGSNEYLSWGARSDVGLVRAHNEDSFLVKAPLFAVCDGMGGHAAGEVASGIAVATIADLAPEHADEILLGAAVEAANAAVLEASQSGVGKPGMGCTASCVLIEKNRMSIAHVGDSRVYLLHGSTLVRITHDHSFVEELVDAGELTADDARIHPDRSIITRALGTDPDMYADHFTLDVSAGDRIIVCSDGLSSMISDKEIEDLSVSSVTPQAAADTLVSAALTAGGHDNVTVVVVDVLDDGLADIHRKERNRNVRTWLIVFVLGLVVVAATLMGIVRNSWYLGNNDGTVGIYRGINDSILGIPFFELIETTSISVSDLPEATRLQLDQGIAVENENEGRATVERYRDQIDADKTRARQAAEAATSAANQQSPKKTQEDAQPGEPEDQEPPAPAQPEEAQPQPEGEEASPEVPAEAASSIVAASQAPAEATPAEAAPAPEAPAEPVPAEVAPQPETSVQPAPAEAAPVAQEAGE